MYAKYRTKALNPQCHAIVSGAANNGSGLVRITTTYAHGLQTSDIVWISGVTGTGGLTAAVAPTSGTGAGGVWTVTAVGSTTFDLVGSTFAGTYTSGGIVAYTDAALLHAPFVVRWGVGAAGDNIKCCMVNVTGAGTLYTPSLTADEFLSDIPGASIIATSSNMTTKTVVNGSVGGVGGCADFTFTSVSGTTVEALVFYKDTSVTATSSLIAFIDSGSATGLPVTPNGSSIGISVDPTSKLFVL